MQVCTSYNAVGNTSHLDIVPQLCDQIIQLNFPNILDFHPVFHHPVGHH